jgi:Ser/Thr protein kinase RdoA (MazF antagonist)
MSDEVLLEGGGRNLVTLKDGVVYRKPAPWSASVMALLRHLEREGFDYAPRVVGSGFDAQGREMVRFIPGSFVHPGPWGEEAFPLLGQILRQLHEAAASFVPPEGAQWRPWYGRPLGVPSVFGHCDTGSWNIVAEGGMPIALIDWEEAGPVDPLVELAQACWLNAQLFDDDIADKQGLASPEARGRQMRLLLDGYGLARAERAGMVGLIRDFAILSADHEAVTGRGPETTDGDLLAAVTWRARSAAWVVRHRAVLERSIL